MLRDELLRSKNDEIARCLLSRKRKLSELYFATVGFAGATENAPTNALYHQKEQTFLDANDLT
ncbi:chromatin modification- protein VID21, partial [Aspergillus fumigatus]